MADPLGDPFYVQSRVREAEWVTIDCLADEELAREMAVIIEERSDPDLDVSARVTQATGMADANALARARQQLAHAEAPDIELRDELRAAARRRIDSTEA